MGKSTTALACGLGFSALALAQGAAAQSIPVADIEALYAAINNPANAGATLVLAPGTYLLSTTDQYGQTRPKGGRLELQYDMSLQGIEGDRQAVVIDAYNLPASSFPSAITSSNAAAGPNAPLRMGLGHNRIEWLTVRNGRNAQANIDTGLQPLDPETAYVRIAHVESSGSTRGLNVLNFGTATSHQIIEADIVDSDFHDNTVGLSEGVRFGNFQGAAFATVNVRMSGSRSWGHKTGRLVVNNRALDSTVNVISAGNRFYGNGGGTIIVGGLSSNNTRADRNTIHFEARGDQFLDNTAASEFDHGGLVVLGTEDVSAASGGGSYNRVEVELWGARMLDNVTTDAVAPGMANADLGGFGARSLSPATSPHSTNNLVTITLHGDGGSKGKWQPVESFADVMPAGPANGNSVSVVRY